MTWGERFDAVASAVRAFWWVALVVGLFVVVLLFARACNAAGAAAAALARARDDAIADKAGLERVYEATRATLQAELDEARASSATFSAALERAQAALEARPVLVVRASTGPVPVGQPPKEPGTPDPQDPTAPAVSPCLLSDGDTGEIEVTQAVLQTDAGTRILVGAAEAYRMTPEPRLRLFGGSFRTEVTESKAEPLPLRRSPGWGAGIAGGMATTGYLASAIVLTPPILSHLEGVLEFSLGPGLVAGQAGLIYRP